MNFIFSRLSGFEADTLEYLPKNASRKIEWFSFWTFISVFLCCISVSYMVQIETKTWILSVATFFFLFFILYLIQSLLVTCSFIELETTPDNVEKWKPTKARVIIFVFIGVLFSQPLIFYYKALASELSTNVSIGKLENLEKNIIEKTDFYEADKKLSILQKKNIIGQINGEHNSSVVNDEAKKALVLFNGGSNSSEENFAKNLESNGFKVTKQRDVDKEHFNVLLNSYLETLKPGDVSLIFFVGKYQEHFGKIYLLPTDFNSDINETVDLQSYISSLSKRKLFASLFFFGFIGNPSSNLSTTDFKLLAGPDSLILIKNGVAVNNELDDLIKRFTKGLSSLDKVDVSFLALSNDLSNNNNGNSVRLINNLHQPIYLNESKEKKDLTDEDAAKILPAKEYCSNFSSIGKKYVERCLIYQINVIQDGLEYLESVKRSEINKLEKLKDIKKHNSSPLVNYFGSLADNKFKLLVNTLVAVFLISGGFLLRDIGTDSIDLYEKINYKRNKINVLLSFKKFRIDAKKMRIYFLSKDEKVSIANFPNPFRPKNTNKVNVNKDKGASDDFFDSLKKVLNSQSESS